VPSQANYDAAAQQFELHTPNAGAAKNWISQGFVAERAVVLANLTVGEKVSGGGVWRVGRVVGAFVVVVVVMRTDAASTRMGGRGGVMGDRRRTHGAARQDGLP
jgi:hypothetical protein